MASATGSGTAGSGRRTEALPSDRVGLLACIVGSDVTANVPDVKLWSQHGGKKSNATLWIDMSQPPGNIDPAGLVPSFDKHNHDKTMKDIAKKQVTRMQKGKTQTSSRRRKHLRQLGIFDALSADAPAPGSIVRPDMSFTGTASWRVSATMCMGDASLKLQYTYEAHVSGSGDGQAQEMADEYHPINYELSASVNALDVTVHLTLEQAGVVPKPVGNVLISAGSSDVRGITYFYSCPTVSDKAREITNDVLDGVSTVAGLFGAGDLFELTQTVFNVASDPPHLQPCRNETTVYHTSTGDAVGKTYSGQVGTSTTGGSGGVYHTGAVDGGQSDASHLVVHTAGWTDGAGWGINPDSLELSITGVFEESATDAYGRNVSLTLTVPTHGRPTGVVAIPPMPDYQHDFKLQVTASAKSVNGESGTTQATFPWRNVGPAFVHAFMDTQANRTWAQTPDACISVDPTLAYSCAWLQYTLGRLPALGSAQRIRFAFSAYQLYDDDLASARVGLAMPVYAPGCVPSEDNKYCQTGEYVDPSDESLATVGNVGAMRARNMTTAPVPCSTCRCATAPSTCSSSGWRQASALSLSATCPSCVTSRRRSRAQSTRRRQTCGPTACLATRSRHAGHTQLGPVLRPRERAVQLQLDDCAGAQRRGDHGLHRPAAQRVVAADHRAAVDAGPAAQHSVRLQGSGPQHSGTGGQRPVARLAP
jgi:hypothetical protein